MSLQDAVVYVVDDDISVREALTNLFRSVGLRVETYGSAQEFLSGAQDSAPSCLVLDVRLPGLSGLDLQHQLAKEKVEIPIVFVTAHGDIRMSVRAMKDGAIEFLTKPFRDQELLDAVGQAIGRSQEALRNRAETAEIRQRYQSLTSRELEVMREVVHGLSNKQIAAELGIREPTVKMHRGRLMRKMEAVSLAGLVRMAEKLGIPRGS